MKNITVSVDDELYHLARIRAAELRTTVSALVRSFLQRIVYEDTRFDRFQALQNAVIERIVKSGAGISAAERLRRDPLPRLE